MSASRQSIGNLRRDDGLGVARKQARFLQLAQAFREHFGGQAGHVFLELAETQFLMLLQQLTFISSEVHKGFGPLFAGPNPAAREKLEKRLSYVAERLKGHPFLLGEQFTLADAYLYTTLTWAEHVQVNLAPFEGLKAYRDRVAARPKVRQALEAEGLLNPAHS